MKLQGVILGTLALVLVVIVGATPVEAATTTWVGGASGLWNSGANWSSGLVPTAADDVLLTNGTHATITVQFGETINFHNLTVITSTLLLNGDVANGTNIVINSDGVVEQGNGNVQKISSDIVINSGGLLTHTPLPNSSSTPMVNIEAGNVLVSGGAINVEGRGYAGGGLGQDGRGQVLQVGHGSPTGAGGGANCGNGGTGTGASGGFSGASPALFPVTFDYGSGGGWRQC